MIGKRAIFSWICAGSLTGIAFFQSWNIISSANAQAAPEQSDSPSPTTRPLFQELNREAQSLFRDVAGSIARVQLPISGTAIVDDPLSRWSERLDPEFRKEIEEMLRRSSPGGFSRLEVQPATNPSDANNPAANPHIIMLQQARFSPNSVAIVFDDAQHVLVPHYVEKDAFGGPVIVQLADGRMGLAKFVASDQLADVTILQLQDLKPKAAQISPNRPAEGELLLVMSMNPAFNRLAVWEGWQPDFAVIVAIDSRIAGFTKAGQFISAATFAPAVKELIEHGVIRRAHLGVTITAVGVNDPQRVMDPALGQTPAIRIRNVAPDSPAARGGLLPGDLILTLAGQCVGDENSFAAAIAERRGKTELTILRNDRLLTVTVDLEVQ